MPYIGQDLQVAYPTYLNIDDISGSFNGSTTSFALLVSGSAPVPLPLNSQQCLISVGGVIQRPDDSGTEGFRLSGGNIIFSSAPNTGEDFFGVILAGADYVNAGANFPDGQVGAPSITFDQDNDTGFYRSGSGDVTFSSNGVANSVFSSNSFTAPSFIPTSSTVPTNGVYLPAANSVAISTNGSERALIDSSGRLLVGTSSSRSVGGNNERGLQIESTTTGPLGISVVRNSNDASGNTLVFGKSRGTSIGSSTVVIDNDTLGAIAFAGADGTDLGSFGAFIQAQVDGTPGANDMPGRLMFSTTADGSASPTERMRIDSGGRLLIGTTTAFASTSSTDTGNYFTNGALICARASNTVLFIGRQNNDGNLVEFRQAGTLEGSISVSGTAVSYNGAHLSRWSQILGIDPNDKDQRPEILRGTLMSNLDEMCDWIDPESGEAQDNEQLNKTKISDVEGDKNVAGVFQSWDDDDDTWVNDYYLAMTGDFVIRIAAGITVERGDLLMSAGDGTAKPQGDGYVQDKTIAKVTSTNVSCTYDDGSYCVPCVLMAC